MRAGSFRSALRQHFFNVYAYCRIADDLGDEVGDPEASLQLLDEWQAELDACYEAIRGIRCSWPWLRRCASSIFRDSHLRIYCRHFVRTRLSPAMKPFRIWLGYCHYSANPVGHLVLYLCGYRDPERQALSDCTCTALQLANFWQDVSVDYAKGRIYLPLEDLHRYGVTEEEIATNRNTRGILRDDAIRSAAGARVVQRGLAACLRRSIANWRLTLSCSAAAGKRF